LRGIACFALAILLFAVMDVMIKRMTAGYGTFQIIFFRSLTALVPISILVAHSGGLAALRTRRPLGHVVRALIGACATFSFFFSFRYLPLADVYTINFAAPLIMTALSLPLLGEHVGRRRWCAVVVGFGGVVVVLQPTGAMVSPVALVCLAGAFFYALTLILIRRLSRIETSAAIAFYFTLTCIGLGAVGMIPDWVTPRSFMDAAMLAGIGIVGGAAQILITSALRLAPAGTLAPFEYTALIWGVAFGWLFFGDLPAPPVVLGGMIVVASGLYILYRETRRAAV
ncbi:MAG TPA: DMT family transporter, partial [Arenibaculum sp.]|nr:DMT family transporter [Arenibaculum sp.]